MGLTKRAKQSKNTITSFIQEVTALQKENQELKTLLNELKTKYRKITEINKELIKMPQIIKFIEQTENTINEMNKIEEEKILNKMNEESEEFDDEFVQE